MEANFSDNNDKQQSSKSKTLKSTLDDQIKSSQHSVDRFIKIIEDSEKELNQNMENSSKVN